MKQKKKNDSIIFIVLIIVAVIIAGISVTFLMISDTNQEQPFNDPSEPSPWNNTISPPSIRQAVAVEMQRIHKRGIEDVMRTRGRAWKQDPSFFFIVNMHDAEWVSNTIQSWDTGYVGWETYRFVEDETMDASIDITIYEKQRTLFGVKDVLMESIMVMYDFKTGRWSGDDSFNDSDGYGHYVGTDYEIWFNIYQTDNDNDNIPFWTENNILMTDAFKDDTTLDPDNDGIPTSWEWKWGYDPFTWDNHSSLDPDEDGLQNTEEYQMRKWLANPYHKDIYMEVDFMEEGPGILGHDHILHEESQWLLMDAFIDHHITIHIDDGWPTGSTIGGGELLPYSEDYIGPFSGMASSFYKYHFSDDRKGIFRYVLVLHDCGWNFCQDHKLWPDVITIPDNNQYFRNVYIPSASTERLKRLAHGVVLMHELGHSMGLNPSYCAGIDNASQAGRNNLPPLQKWIERIDAWKYWWDYQSVMNYQKLNMYYLDYSDGSHGPRDKDDWSYIDVAFFQKPIPPEEDYDVSDS